MDTARTSQPWYQFIGELDWLLIDVQYAWAASLLIAIRDTVIASKRVNDAQRRTVDTIRARTAGVQ
jgi:hypothetical protein